MLHWNNMLYVQYANSQSFQNILYGGTNEDGQFAGLNSYLNLYWQDFYNQIFNINSATVEGLNLWGEILNTGSQYYLPIQPSIFGFNVNPGNTTDYAQNFEHGTFYSGGVYSILPFDQYRCLLMLRAQYFICNGSILAITRILNDFFINLTNFDKTSGYDYNISVTVSVDSVIAYKVNYVFRHTVTASSSLPLWINSLFGNGPVNYLPIPIGGYQNITIF